MHVLLITASTPLCLEPLAQKLKSLLEGHRKQDAISATGLIRSYLRTEMAGLTVVTDPAPGQLPSDQAGRILIVVRSSGDMETPDLDERLRRDFAVHDVVSFTSVSERHWECRHRATVGPNAVPAPAGENATIPKTPLVLAAEQLKSELAAWLEPASDEAISRARFDLDESEARSMEYAACRRSVTRIARMLTQAIADSDRHTEPLFDFLSENPPRRETIAVVWALVESILSGQIKPQRPVVLSPLHRHSRKTGRLNQQDSVAKKAHMFEILRQDPAMINDYRELARRVGVSKSTTRRWIARVNADKTESFSRKSTEPPASS